MITLLLDRDGTLIRDDPYSGDPSTVTLLPTVITGLQQAIRWGWRLMIITNQSGIARGLLTEASFWARHRQVLVRLAHYDIPVTATYYCPHHPDGRVPRYTKACSCRKPAPGLLHQAMRDYQCAPETTHMIGDKPSDYDAGVRAGIHSHRLGSASFETLIHRIRAS